MIAYCEVYLNIPGVQSLKEKRRIIKSLQDKLKNKFNIAISEIGNNDLWQSSLIGVVTIGNETAYLEKMLNSIINFIDEFYGVEISQYDIEYF